VIIGSLIPSGTGMKEFREIELVEEEEEKGLQEAG